MSRFLLDANLSPQTATHLRRKGYDVKSITEEHLGQLTDLQVVSLAREEKRVIITFDLDFGEIYHTQNPTTGVIVIRTKDQTVESVNHLLSEFLKNYKSKLSSHHHSLIVIKSTSIRFVK